ncbi:MAG: AAA family ATPase [Clostridium sp.]
MTVLNGKNGTGKSTILDIIGMNREDRMAQICCDIENKVFNEYFLLYFWGKDKQKDIYGIEFCGNNIFDCIKNCKIKDDHGYNKSKECIGIQFTYDGKRFNDTGRHYFDGLISEESKSISKQIHVFKCDTIGKYSKRVNYNSISKKEEYKNYLAKRFYLAKADNSTKYETIVNIKNNNKIEFFNEELILEIRDRIDKKIIYYIEGLDENKKNFKEKLEKAKESIEESLGIKKNSWYKVLLGKLDNKKELTKEEIKEFYIYQIISKYILYEIICGLAEYINNYIDDNKIYEGDELEFLDKIDNIEDLENTIETLGKPINFEVEKKGIDKIINKYKNSFKNKYEGLMQISRYVNGRIEAGYEFGEENGYQKAFEDLIESFLKLSNKYFTKEGIYIHIKDQNDFDCKVIELLELFKKHEVENDKKHNSLPAIFEINFNDLSDGEKELIDMISNIFYADKISRDAELVILLFDEPDCFLHPEWSRKFLSIIIDYINTFKNNFQIILTTHSPYLISDMFPQNVFRFNRDENNDLKIERLSNSSNSCFGANIYDLLNNSFFMKNSIGEFATKYIKEVIKDIDELEKLYEEDKNKYKSTVEKIEFCINNIGDPVLKDNISKMYYLKKRKIKPNDIRNINDWDATYNEILDNISNEEEKKKVKKLMDNFRGEK